MTFNATGGQTYLIRITGFNHYEISYTLNLAGPDCAGASGVPGDVDGDGVVGISDLLTVLGNWGPCPAPCPPTSTADFDGDCVVGVTDLLILLGNWTQ